MGPHPEPKVVHLWARTVFARHEAIQEFATLALDCHAPLAMTGTPKVIHTPLCYLNIVCYTITITI